MQKCDIFLIFAQNIDFGYTLEPPQRGGAVITSTHNLCFRAKIKKEMNTLVNPSFNNLCFRAKIKKEMNTLVNPSFTHDIKVGVRGITHTDMLS